MKRGTILLIIFFLLIAPIILADEATTQDQEGISTTASPKEQLGAIRGGLEKETEDILEREVNIPEELGFFHVLIKGIGGGTEAITWKGSIAAIAVAILILITMREILELTAFQTNWVKFTIAGGVTLLAALFGGIYKIVTLLYVIINSFRILMGILFAAILLFFLVNFFLEKIRNKKKISKAEELGMKSGVALKGLSKMSDAAAAILKK